MFNLETAIETWRHSLTYRRTILKSDLDELERHVRDEVGLNDISKAKPIQAAFASGASFTVGGLLPLLVVLFVPLSFVEYSLYGFALFFLSVLGALAAKAGGSSITKAVVRIT